MPNKEYLYEHRPSKLYAWGIVPSKSIEISELITANHSTGNMHISNHSAGIVSRSFLYFCGHCSMGPQSRVSSVKFPGPKSCTIYSKILYHFGSRGEWYTPTPRRGRHVEYTSGPGQSITDHCTWPGLARVHVFNNLYCRGWVATIFSIY